MSDLLEQRLSRLRNPMDDSDWNDVQRKARRPIRRAVLAMAVAATAALLVAPAFGIGDRFLDLIQGPKAPPEVQTSFTANDAARKRHYAFAQATGAEMHDRFSPVVPGEARGITTIETADGPIQLWAAPTEDGRQCWLVQTDADPTTGRPYGGGSCDGIDRAGPIQPDGPMWTIERPHILIMHVRVYDDDITRVQVGFEGADELSLPVVSGHALGTIPEQEHIRLRSVAGFNSDGDVVARWAAPVG
jgi:hypothetical protein